MAQVDLEKLTKPFPKSAIKQRQAGGGRKLDYVEGHVVIHRLNDATGNRWDMEVKEIDSRTFGKPNDRGVQPMLMTARVALTLPGLGTREGIGVQVYYEGTGEDLVKGCVTDALKKAATLFGVGLELYGPDYEDVAESPVAQNGARRDDPPAETARTATNAPARVTEHASRSQDHPATPTQLRRMHAMARDLGWADGDWKPTVYKDYGVAHINELTTQQADAVIARFARKLQQLPVPMSDVAMAAPGEPGNDALTR